MLINDQTEIIDIETDIIRHGILEKIKNKGILSNKN